MHRLLLIDIDGLLPSGESRPKALTWVPWLAEVLRPWNDVRIVLHSTGNPCSTSAGWSQLGELAPRLIGSTYGLPPEEAIDAALRTNKLRVDHHLVMVAHLTALPEGQFNVLVCDAERGLSAPKTQAALAAWLRQTAPAGRSVLRGRLPKGYGERVLYLDFDGVLHHENVHYHPRRGAYMATPGFALFEHAGLLEELLLPYPDLRIVLSTSWVRQYGCTGTAKRLATSLSSRVIGATFHSRMDKGLFLDKPRGVQVWEDSLRRKPLDWLALDDDYIDWPDSCVEKYLRTDEVLGIGAPGAADEIARRLKRMHEPASKVPPTLDGPPGA